MLLVSDELQQTSISETISQMLSMMKPLPNNAEYPSEFFVEDLEYLPRTIYHIIRKTLWPVKGHSSATKLEGAALVISIVKINGILSRLWVNGFN